ncbi:hypothetical protein [Paraburkholderia franconis]|uniref:hypothetical protein n=1 Tax=Paraburkholderia franconis TaxID=2654983 RepID=UPI001D123F16|nr:hypothetical protein [Paraburkholderia franconis]
MLRERIGFGRILRPDDGVAKQLHVTAAGDPRERFVDGERQAQVMAATTAHRA